MTGSTGVVPNRYSNVSASGTPSPAPSCAGASGSCGTSVWIRSRRLSIVPDTASTLTARVQSRHAESVERAIANSRSAPLRQRRIACPLSIASTEGCMAAAATSPKSETTASYTAFRVATFSTTEEADPWWEPSTHVVDAFAEFLCAHTDVTAVYATNAFLALVAFRAVERLHLRIPEDISFVCIDPLEAIPLSLPTVTCCVQQADAIGRTAVVLLREMLAGQPPRTVFLPMILRDHGSIGRPTRRASE